MGSFCPSHWTKCEAATLSTNGCVPTINNRCEATINNRCEATIIKKCGEATFNGCQTAALRTGVNSNKQTVHLQHQILMPSAVQQTLSVLFAVLSCKQVMGLLQLLHLTKVPSSKEQPRLDKAAVLIETMCISDT